MKLHTNNTNKLILFVTPNEHPGHAVFQVSHRQPGRCQ